MSKVFLKMVSPKTVDMMRITSSASVFGGVSGNEVASIDDVQYLDADNIFILDANIEKMILKGIPSDYKFSALGNVLSVYKFASNVATLIGKVTVQEDVDGTAIDFVSSTGSKVSCTINLITTDTSMSIKICDVSLTTTPVFASSTPADVTKPTVTLSLPKTSFTAGETATLSITFSEPVTLSSGISGFFSINNCTVTNIQGSGSNYTATFTAGSNVGGSASINSSHYVQFLQNAATDAAGNLSQMSSAIYFAITAALDTTKPTATFTVDKSNLVVGEATTMHITFSKPVTGLSIAGLVNNTFYSYTNLQGSGANYTVTLSSDKTSTGATLGVSKNAVHDSSGNFNDDIFSSINLIITPAPTTAPTNAPTTAPTNDPTTAPTDTTKPTVTLSLSKNSFNNSGTDSATLTIIFSEPVTGLTIDDFTIWLSNGSMMTASESISNLSGSGTTYNATFTNKQKSEASGKIYFNNGAVTDYAGNQNWNYSGENPYVSFSVFASSTQAPTTAPVDTTKPVATLSLSSTTIQSGGTATITVTFSEPVTGLTNTDFYTSSNSNSSITNVQGSGTYYTATLNAGSTATSSSFIYLLANAVTDAAGNGNANSNTVSFSVAPASTTAPTQAPTQAPTITLLMNPAGSCGNNTLYNQCSFGTISGLSPNTIYSFEALCSTINGVDVQVATGFNQSGLATVFGETVHPNTTLWSSLTAYSDANGVATVGLMLTKTVTTSVSGSIMCQASGGGATPVSAVVNFSF